MQTGRALAMDKRLKRFSSASATPARELKLKIFRTYSIHFLRRKIMEPGWVYPSFTESFKSTGAKSKLRANCKRERYFTFYYRLCGSMPRWPPHESIITRALIYSGCRSPSEDQSIL